MCIRDSHNTGELLDVFEQASSVQGKPTVIIAETIKGKGVSFMEGQAGWHGKAPKPEQVEIALKELNPLQV